MSGPAQQEPAALYEALAEIIERELAVVRARDFDAFRALKRERGAIVKRLPSTPPPEARAALRRCRITQAQITLELRQLREVVLGELRQLRLARRAADGYRPAPQVRRRRIAASA